MTRFDHQSLLRGSRPASRTYPARGTAPAGLRQAATGTDQRQPGPAPDQPVPLSRAGDYGDRSYPGNCGGNLIKDLLRYFKPFSVLDPMTGSGTCRDVCKELGIYCCSSDLHEGADACDASQFPRAVLRFLLGPSALLADEALHRRPAMPFPRTHAASLPGTLPPADRQLRRFLSTRRQVGHPDGGLQRPRRRIRPAGVLHQAACHAGRLAAALHRHHPLQPRQQQLQEGVPEQLHSGAA